MVIPFRFGAPKFYLVPIVTMCIVMVVVMIESTGMFLALGEMTGRKIDQAAITRGLRADGVGTILGGIFNTFPYTSFSQNVGLVGVTGIRSRWVTATGGVIMLALGLLPKMSALVESVPVVVLGGAGIVMFGMVAATGARILTNVDFKTNRHNLFVVAISVGFGMIPLVAPNFFRHTPDVLHPLLESGILLAAIVSVLLNVFFNGLRQRRSRATRGLGGGVERRARMSARIDGSDRMTDEVASMSVAVIRRLSVPSEPALLHVDGVTWTKREGQRHRHADLLAHVIAVQDRRFCAAPAG